MRRVVGWRSVSNLVKVYVDLREKASHVPKYLTEMGVSVIYKQLEVGDYMVTEDTVIERKRVDDLAHSVFEGRFFDQVRRLKASGLRTFILVEGDLMYLRRITNKYKAVEAALVTAVIYNNIPVIYTRNAKHTAETIKLIAEKLQTTRKPSAAALFPTYRKQQKPKEQDLSEWQLYVLASFPGIGPTLADRLLRKFGSLRAVLEASPVELSRVEGVSEEKAQLIKRILDYPYSKKHEEAGGGLERFYGKEHVKKQE